MRLEQEKLLLSPSGVLKEPKLERENTNLIPPAFRNSTRTLANAAAATGQAQNDNARSEVASFGTRAFASASVTLQPMRFASMEKPLTSTGSAGSDSLTLRFTAHFSRISIIVDGSAFSNN